MKKLVALILAAAMAASLAACGGDAEPAGTEAPATDAVQTDTQAGTESTEPATDAAELPDMGGYKFVMGDWWSDAVYTEKEPSSAWDQLKMDYHHELMDKMNFGFEQIGLQNQGDYESVIVNDFVNNKPQCSAFQVKISQFVPLAAQGLLADFSKYVR